MRVNTVVYPIKAMQYNPATGREELMPTGMLQEYSGGKPIGAPIKAPGVSHVPQDRGMTTSMQMGQQGYNKWSPPVQAPAPITAFQRPGESQEAALDRYTNAASQFTILPGTNRAVVGFNADGTVRQYDQGHGGY